MRVFDNSVFFDGVEELGRAQFELAMLELDQKEVLKQNFTGFEPSLLFPAKRLQYENLIAGIDNAEETLRSIITGQPARDLSPTHRAAGWHC